MLNNRYITTTTLFTYQVCRVEAGDWAHTCFGSNDFDTADSIATDASTDGDDTFAVQHTPTGAWV